MSDDLKRFREQCFQFACDKLDPEAHAWMLAMLEIHPAWQEYVDNERELVALLREGLSEEPPVVSFEEIQQALRSQGPAVQPAKPAPDNRASWWRRLVTTPASNGSRWAVAAMVVLSVTAVFQMRHQVSRDAVPDEGYRGATPAEQQSAGVMLVRFRDDVAMGALTDQLETLHLRLGPGPDKEGRYQVVVTAGTLQQAVDALRASSVALDVQVMDMRDRNDR